MMLHGFTDFTADLDDHDVARADAECSNDPRGEGVHWRQRPAFVTTTRSTDTFFQPPAHGAPLEAREQTLPGTLRSSMVTRSAGWRVAPREPTI